MNKLFDPHGWVYGTRRSAEVAYDELLEHVDGSVRAHLSAVLMRLGGKAFGLRLCEQIAAKSEYLTVPPWTGIQISEIMFQDLGLFIGCIPWLKPEDMVILRSSSHEEDWMSADSGVLSSPSMAYGNLRVGLIDTLSHRVPQVIQKFHDGLGIVVDIGWSELMAQPVVRIAAGREYRTGNIRRFSSATSDHEGPIVVLDLEGKELLKPQRGALLVDQPVQLPYALIAKELVRAVSSSIGTKFGVQIELVIHPDKPNVWHLVQLRPTPGRVRCRTDLPVLNSAGRIAQTAAVSGSFYHKEKARILTPSEQKWLMAAEMAGPDDPEMIEKGTAMFNGVKVLVWEDPPHPDFGIFQMRMLHRLGSVGQITRNAITLNTSHGKVQLWIDTVDQSKREIVHSCSLLGLRESQHERVLKELRDGPHLIEIISDGLIGEVHLAQTSDS